MPQLSGVILKRRQVLQNQNLLYMRHILSLLIFITASFFCNAQSTGLKKLLTNDLKELNLKGKIQSLIETYYGVMEKAGEPVKGTPGTKYVYKFNATGFETEFSSYEGSDILAALRTTKYDAKGKKMEQSENFADRSRNTHCAFKYDNKGNLAEEAFLDGNKITYKYNNQNELTEKITFVKKENVLKPEEKITMSYDKKGNLTEYIAYNADGSLILKELNKYDSAGNLIEQCKIVEEGKPCWKTINKYNEKGKITEQFMYDTDGTAKDYAGYKYNDQGILIEETKGIGRKNVTAYDNYGNPAESLSGTRKLTYKYEYDNSGNWVKQTLYRNNKPSQIIERVIQYY